MKTLLSIVIPCYNEEKNIPLILERFQAAIENYNSVEVILVDNGSQDNSATVLAEQLPNYPFAKSIRVEVNKGYGYGILMGLNSAKGEFLGWSHADLQTDPSDVLKALDMLEAKGRSQNLYIKGERKGRRFLDNLFSLGMSLFESIYLRVKLWEINAQPNIFHRSFFDTWEKPPYDFSLDLYAYYMAKKQRLEIIRFPVLFPERIHGTSSWNTSCRQKVKFILRTLNYSRALKNSLMLQEQ